MSTQIETVTPAYMANKSGSITSGNTAQTLMAANDARKGFYVQNVSSGDLWINENGSDAVLDQPSLKITPNQLYESPPNGTSLKAVSIIGATTGQKFAAREW